MLAHMEMEGQLLENVQEPDPNAIQDGDLKEADPLK